MKPEAKEYSVLMSVYEKEQPKFLAESMESMLGQSVPPKDFVLMCDGALTDALDAVIAEKVKEYPGLFQIIRLETCGGLGNALAIGLKKCRCERVARMDSDDISALDRCERQLQIFEEQDVAIVGSNIVEFEGDVRNSRTIRCVPETDAQIRRFAKRRNPFNHPSVMFQKSVVLKVGNYQDCKGFEDYYLWVRLLKNGYRGYNIQENLVHMRTDAGMYERRGSVSYAWLALKARWKIHRTGYARLSDFLVSALGQLALSILPTDFRRKIYGRILRK